MAPGSKADDKVEAEVEDQVSFNLDEKRRAREAKLGKPKSFQFGGERFDLPLEAPYEFAEHLAIGNYRGAVKELLDGRADEFFALRPSIPDVEELVKELADIYAGVTPGESGASSGSSAKTGSRSRRPSRGSTAKS